VQIRKGDAKGSANKKNFDVDAEGKKNHGNEPGPEASLKMVSKKKESRRGARWEGSRRKQPVTKKGKNPGKHQLAGLPNISNESTCSTVSAFSLGDLRGKTHSHGLKPTFKVEA